MIIYVKVLGKPKHGDVRCYYYYYMLVILYQQNDNQIYCKAAFLEDNEANSHDDSQVPFVFVTLSKTSNH